jgi:hypothetical protein
MRPATLGIVVALAFGVCSLSARAQSAGVESAAAPPPAVATPPPFAAPPLANPGASAAAPIPVAPVPQYGAPVVDAELWARSQNLERTMEKLAVQNSPSTGASIVRLLTGAAWVGLGALFAFGDEEFAGDGISRVAGVTGAVILGVPSLVAGIRGLSGVTSTDEDRLARYRSERAAGPPSVIQLAHYEGELRADAEISRKQRISGGYHAVGSAAAGGVMIGFAAASDLPDNARVLGGILGGIFLVAGVWDAVANFTGESNNEREWRLYKSQVATPPVRPSAFTVRPSFGRHGVGVEGAF